MLEVKEVAKRFKSGKGVGPVSFCIQQGTVCSIVGPNGAGKSTLFNVLSMVSEDFSGTWSLNNKTGRRIPQGTVSYLPESPFLIQSFTPRQFCAFDASMRGISHSSKLIEKHLTVFACKDFLDTPLEYLSQGMAKRVMIACAFLGNPQLILLDEPLNAIDIQTMLILKDQITIKKEQGSIILISSHILDFLDEVSDQILFLNQGYIIDSFEPRNEKAESRYRRMFLE